MADAVHAAWRKYGSEGIGILHKPLLDDKRIGIRYNRNATPCARLSSKLAVGPQAAPAMPITTNFNIIYYDYYKKDESEPADPSNDLDLKSLAVTKIKFLQTEKQIQLLVQDLILETRN